MTHTCATCEKPLYNRNKSGFCKPCFLRQLSAIPEIRERRSKGMKRYLEDPNIRAERNKKLRRALACPERRKVKSELAHKSRFWENAPNAPAGSEQRIRAGIAKTRTTLAWCPPEYRDLYRDLFDRRKGSGPECKAMILDLIEADKRRFMRTGELQQTVRAG